MPVTSFFREFIIERSTPLSFRSCFIFFIVIISGHACSACVSYPQALPCLAHVFFESRLEPLQQSLDGNTVEAVVADWMANNEARWGSWIK